VQPISSSQIISHNKQDEVSNRKYLWFVPAIGITVLVIVWTVGIRKKNNTVKTLSQANKIAQSELPQVPPSAVFTAEKQKINITEELKMLASVNELAAFFAFSKALLTQAIQQKCETAETSETLLLRALQHVTKNEILVALAQSFYKNCNMALYASAVQYHQRDEIYEQLSKIILQLQDNDYSV
jgi:hypothetical protein